VHFGKDGVKTNLHFPVVASQESTVQSIPSSQEIGVTWHVQVSLVLTNVAVWHLLDGWQVIGHGGGGLLHVGLETAFLTHLLSVVSQETVKQAPNF
jgi:hypothetical protein